MPKLKTGDIIQVYGWVMAQKVKPGRYYILRNNDPDVYYLRRIGSRGRLGKLICHRVRTIDIWIKPTDHSDLNKIVILNQ